MSGDVAVYGLDPSLTSFGISNGVRHETIKTPAHVPTGDRAGTIVGDIERFVSETRACGRLLFAIEAPLLSSATGSGHLYDLGFVMCRIDLYARDLRARGFEVSEIWVPSPTLRKWALGKGNIKKDEMKLAVFRKFGVAFDDDPGADKLFAYLLWRYGRAVIAGEVEHKAPATRGKGKDARAEMRKAARTRALVTT